MLKKLRPRWFVVRDARGDEPTLLNPRWAMSYLRGPMTPVEIRRARQARSASTGAPTVSATVGATVGATVSATVGAGDRGVALDETRA